MRRRHVSFLILAISVLGISNSAAFGDFKIFGRKSKAADSLELTNKQGPWMIYAASFAGPGAEEEAKQLAIELRSRFKVKSYVHSKEYDFSKSVEGIGFNRDLSRKTMRYNQDGAFSEIAVMVGSYNSVDDPDLQKTLKMLKYAQPQSLSTAKEKTTLRFGGLRALQRRINGDNSKNKKGPLGRAFAVPNPLVPRESYAPKGVDTFVFKINKDVEYSLLDCPGNYSVRVATFRGTVITNQQKVKEIQEGGRLKSTLEEAAIKAHKVTMKLRELGHEAYEFHDRHESYVTVGSFDWVGEDRLDGKQEINPKVHAMIKKFSPSNGANPQVRSVSARPKKVAGISLDAQPIPVQVPKRSLASDYSRKKWFR